ncbi:MAG: hypothetical protein FLDDKLPJ_03793 [Phycisphaerae bacterium]|nr:hypothetical protein [Phycisphaerae bacterium]
MGPEISRLSTVSTGVLLGAGTKSMSEMMLRLPISSVTSSTVPQSHELVSNTASSPGSSGYPGLPDVAQLPAFDHKSFDAPVQVNVAASSAPAIYGRMSSSVLKRITKPSGGEQSAP